jgi:hypothetical protein
MVQIRSEWATVVHPEDPSWSIAFEVTFLLSHYHCIFGKGCPDIYGKGTARGCCPHGAHVVKYPEDQADVEELERIEGRVAALTNEDWQRREQVLARGGGNQAWGKRRGAEGSLHTRTIDGACVFFNGPDHPAGSGCAFHIAALRRGENPNDWKPTTCWGVPIFMDTDEEERLTTVRAVRHADWGEGTLGYWCMDDPAAYTSSLPVYVSLADELRRLVGDEAYEAIAEYCRARENGEAVHLPMTRPLNFIGTEGIAQEPDGTTGVPLPMFNG